MITIVCMVVIITFWVVELYDFTIKQPLNDYSDFIIHNFTNIQFCILVVALELATAPSRVRDLSQLRVKKKTRFKGWVIRRVSGLKLEVVPSRFVGHNKPI